MQHLSKKVTLTSSFVNAFSIKYNKKNERFADLEILKRQ